MHNKSRISRRDALKLAGAGAAVAAFPFARPAISQGAPLRVGLLLPYSGTFAALGVAITNAMDLYVKQQGGKLAGRTIEWIKVDDESAPPKATELTSKLVQGEKVDVLIGTVHSGVAMAMAKIAREAGLPTLIPNAGANVLTRQQCAKNIFRTSFGNSQPGVAAGEAMIKAGIKTAVTYTWGYAAGEESVDGFKQSFLKGGGKIIKELRLPFPNVEFQAGLAEIASLKPQAVYSFYAGGGALKFMQDFAAAGLKNSIQLWGPGFLTDGVESKIGAAGNGVKTASHYVESLDNAENKKFRADYNAAFKMFPDVYAVQGWDTTHVLDIGLKAAGGDVKKQDVLFKAMREAKFNSPRGPFRLSASQNPIHNFYLRELQNGENKFLGIAATDVSDPTTGCSLA